MQPESRRLLSDMLEAARAVRDFAGGRTLDHLQNDDLLRSAIYFKFAIIGEALAQLRKLDPPTVQRITEGERIIGFRNQIIHGYARVDDEITWRIVEEKLPVLIDDLRDLLGIE